MNDFKKQLEKFSMKIDLINSILGIALIVSIVLIFIIPYNRYTILSACICGGLINILNGLMQSKTSGKNTARKSAGMSLIMIGFVVIIVGFVIINIL